MKQIVDLSQSAPSLISSQNFENFCHKIFYQIIALNQLDHLIHCIHGSDLKYLF